VIALRKLTKGTQIYNLATNKGLSVLDVIKAFERVNNIKINYTVGPRRPGDVATSYADSTKVRVSAKMLCDWLTRCAQAQKELGWT
jgi:UDP-glucose 4-epimerase